MSELTIPEAEEILEANLAPWIQELNIAFDQVGPDGAVLRIPPSPLLCRQGGTICGQAIMALADTAMIFAIAGIFGEFTACTTVNQTSSFLRPAAAAADLVARAKIIKPGRTIIYGDVTLHAADPAKPPEKLVAHVTSTYMLI
jgi:uncharacterized protein (TIGR00369 family)